MLASCKYFHLYYANLSHVSMLRIILFIRFVRSLTLLPVSTYFKKHTNTHIIVISIKCKWKNINNLVLCEFMHSHSLLPLSFLTLQFFSSLCLILFYPSPSNIALSFSPSFPPISSFIIHPHPIYHLL